MENKQFSFKIEDTKKINLEGQTYFAVPENKVNQIESNEEKEKKLKDEILKLDSEKEIIKQKIESLMREMTNLKAWLEAAK